MLTYKLYVSVFLFGLFTLYFFSYLYTKSDKAKTLEIILRKNTWIETNIFLILFFITIFLLTFYLYRFWVYYYQKPMYAKNLLDNISNYFFIWIWNSSKIIIFSIIWSFICIPNVSFISWVVNSLSEFIFSPALLPQCLHEKSAFS